MPVAFASSRVSKAETARVDTLLPAQIREETATLIKFIEGYYNFLNSTGLPSNVISSITSSRDIDEVSSVYLDAIGKEIAKTVPNGALVDKVNLYKKIVSYYSTRGTEDSVAIFFRIFFNEIVEIYYPRVDILRASDGIWDPAQGKYVDTKGFLSSDKYLQDGKFYQEFSYLIRSPIPVSDWELQFARLVHPAGLRFFAEIALYLTVLGQSKSWRDTRSGLGVIEDIYITNFHSPLFQPGWLSGADRLVQFFLLSPESISIDQARAVYVTLKLFSSTAINDSYLDKIDSEYDWLKNFDSTPVGEYADRSPFNLDGSPHRRTTDSYDWSTSSVYRSAAPVASTGSRIPDQQIGWAWRNIGAIVNFVPHVGPIWTDVAFTDETGSFYLVSGGDALALSTLTTYGFSLQTVDIYDPVSDSIVPTILAVRLGDDTSAVPPSTTAMSMDGFISGTYYTNFGVLKR
jgi:hypothetical protein